MINLRRFLPVFLCLLVTASYLYAQEGYAVRKVHFIGHETFSKSVLLNQTSLRESNLLTRLFKKQPPSYYNAEFLQADLDRLRRFYQREGFLHAGISLDSVELNEDKQRVNVWVRVDEGKRVMMGKTPFRDEAINIKLGKYVQALVDSGYLYAKGHHTIDLLPGDTVADVSYILEPDSLVRVSNLEISGQRRIKETLILNQSMLKPGDAFTAKGLEETRAYLNDLQLFKVVSVTPLFTAGLRSTTLPLAIRVEEAPSLSGKVGVGYGTEDKFRAFADLTYKGLFGGPTRLNLNMKHSALDPYYVNVKWIHPRFLSRQTALTVNPFLRRQTEPGFETRSLGLNLPVNTRLNEQLDASLGYYYATVTQFGVEGDILVPDPESPNLLYNKSGITAALTYRTAKPLLTPEAGFQVQMGAKVNGYLFGGDYHFTRLWVDARQYSTISHFVLSLRAMGGLLSPTSEDGFIPVEERFYTGGSTSNRGWARSMLGPLRSSGSPAGGKSLLELNMELRRPLFWLLDAAVFVDAGNVWTASLHYPLNELAYAAGAGLRLNTPIGPVRLDVSRPLWHDKKSWQFFLNIGQAF